MPQFRLGPYDFTFSGAYSGIGPTEVKGAGRSMYVVEHVIPGREGGIIEYQGSQQSTYAVRGFLVPQDGGSTAALVLSGTSYIAVNTDDAKDFLRALRGSGNQLWQVESTWSNGSGYQNLYENGFFQIEKVTFAFEAGRNYPYYPYAIDLRGTTPATYGNSSGATHYSGAAGNYLSGYIHAWHMGAGLSGAPRGEVINTIGLYVRSVASGNAKVAVYSGDVNQGDLLAQSATQPVHSGWNYFPIRPSFTTVSGASGYTLAVKGDAANSSGFSIAMFDNGALSTDFSLQSGITYSADFPATLVPGTLYKISGVHLDITMVAGL